MKKLLFLCFGLILAACGENVDIYGKWVEPVPSMPGVIQGFDLEQGGVAESINMATLQYNAWRVDGNKLILSGESIGNHQIIEFTEEYEIVSVDDNTLVLKNGDDVREFTRYTDSE